MKCDCNKWLADQIDAIKDELNSMAVMGVRPMWSSLIARLEQLQADLAARTNK